MKIILLLYICFGIISISFSEEGDTSYLHKAKHFIDIAQYDSALVYSKLAQETYHDADNYTNGLIYLFLSRSYANLGVYDKAVATNFRSLEYTTMDKDTVGIGVRYNDFGNIYMLLKKLDLAEKYFKMALDIFIDQQHLEYKAVTIANIARLFAERGEYDKQFEYDKQVLALYIALNDSGKMGMLYNNIGTYYDIKEKPDSALINYKKSVELEEMTGDGSGVAISQGNIGQVYAKLGKFDSAIYYMDQAITASIERQDISTLLHNYSNLSQVYEDQEQYEKAYSMLLEIREIEDSLYSKESDQYISNLRIVYETEKKETENKLLLAENQLKNERIAAHRQWLIYLIIILLAVILAAIQISLQKKKMSQANKDLAKKNIEIVNSENELANANEQLRVQLNQLKGSKKETKYQGSEISDGQKNEIFSRIEKALLEDKVYLDKELTLSSFAKSLGVGRTYLSQVINEKFQTNYNNLINEYRIKESRRMFASEKYAKYTIEAVGSEAGFKSRSAFNKAFKKFTGITPSYFVDSIRKNYSDS